MRLWQVTRFCCLSGMCFKCRAIVTGGSRKRIVLVENVTQEEAESLARAWSEYGGEASEMPAASVSLPLDSELTPGSDFSSPDDRLGGKF